MRPFAAAATATDRHQWQCRRRPGDPEQRRDCSAAIENNAGDWLNAVLARLYYDLRESERYADFIRGPGGVPLLYLKRTVSRDF
jgi:hypothetical protein